MAFACLADFLTAWPVEKIGQGSADRTGYNCRQSMRHNSLMTVVYLVILQLIVYEIASHRQA